MQMVGFQLKIYLLGKRFPRILRVFLIFTRILVIIRFIRQKRLPGEVIEQRHKDIARSLQDLYESAFLIFEQVIY